MACDNCCAAPVRSSCHIYFALAAEHTGRLQRTRPQSWATSELARTCWPAMVKPTWPTGAGSFRPAGAAGTFGVGAVGRGRLVFNYGLR